MTMKHGKVVAQETVEDKRLKEVLGEDYETFVEFRAQKAKRSLAAAVKTKANDMIGEGGKYGDQWSRLSSQLDAIWDKAMSEARKELGIEEE